MSGQLNFHITFRPNNTNEIFWVFSTELHFDKFDIIDIFTPLLSSLLPQLSPLSNFSISFSFDLPDMLKRNNQINGIFQIEERSKKVASLITIYDRNIDC